jgi:hypothetical protein
LYNLKEVDQSKVYELAARRATYEFPPGLKLIAEYWTPKQRPTVVAIYEADDMTPLMLNTTTWLDGFEIDIFPVTEWEEGLAKIQQMLSR